MYITSRHMVASSLIAIFIIMSLGPLLPLTMQSAAIAHAITGECTGDCNSCGCSLERRASHTCCCWQKKKMRQSMNKSKKSCCKGENTTPKTIISSHCPCGSGKLLAACGVEEFPFNSFPFTGEINRPMTCQVFQERHHHQAIRSNEPPAPPPKISIFS